MIQSLPESILSYMKIYTGKQYHNCTLSNKKFAQKATVTKTLQNYVIQHLHSEAVLLNK